MIVKPPAPAALRIAAFLSALAVASASATANSVVLRGGTLVDGSGEAPREADVWIADGQITGIGEAPDVEADREIDVSGKIVAPGFIDTHSHGNATENPAFENFLRMGVTTICLGQDGSSPYTGDLDEWRETVEANGLGLNIAPFVGHGSVRRDSDVGIEPSPSDEEIAGMVDLVEKAMKAGAFGLTTGLEYQPGSFAEMEELVAVARPVAERNGVVMSHIRSEDADRIFDALDELMEQGRKAEADVHVSHLKIVYGEGTEEAEAVLDHLDEARQEGLTVTADVYPYTASFTGIGIVFPDWAKPPHDYDEVVESRRSELADYLRERVNRRNGPEATLFGSGPWRGQTLAKAASEAEQPFEDLLIEIGPGGASAAYFVMDSEVMERFLSDQHVMVSSDGSPTMRHPRGYGAFARILARYVREKEMLSLEEAIWKMTGLPARTIGLDREANDALPRGRIQEGWAADLTVFDLDEVNDLATFEDPHTFAEGFSHIMVNGRFVIADGQLKPERSGRVLRLPTGE